jgi:hypothetical protein
VLTLCIFRTYAQNERSVAYSGYDLGSMATDDMVRRHSAEPRSAVHKPLTLCSLVLLAVVASCSSSARHAASTTTTTTAPSTDTCAVPAPPSSVNRAPNVPVDGNGPQTVSLPAGLSLPAIVHAQYAGTGVFGVKSRTADGIDSAVLVVSNGAYEGTFPVGFVDQRCSPTTALDVQAGGPWHLDIASADRAPHFTGGLRGVGDAVLAYCGAATQVHLTHEAKSPFVMRTFGSTAMQFTRGAELTDTTVELPAGPLFIVVTTTGTWSIAPAARAATTTSTTLRQDAGACSSS